MKIYDTLKSNGFFDEFLEKELENPDIDDIANEYENDLKNKDLFNIYLVREGRT